LQWRCGSERQCNRPSAGRRPAGPRQARRDARHHRQQRPAGRPAELTDLFRRIYLIRQSAGKSPSGPPQRELAERRDATGLRIDEYSPGIDKQVRVIDAAALRVGDVYCGGMRGGMRLGALPGGRTGMADGGNAPVLRLVITRDRDEDGLV